MNRVNPPPPILTFTPQANNPLEQPASVWYGWGFFTLCGIGSYFLAKRSIRHDRVQRQSFENQRRAELQRAARKRDESRKALNEERAKQGLPPLEDAQEGKDGKRWEATEGFRMKKGDRLG